MNENEILVKYLLELKKELDKEDVPFILGGGMGLYLRRQYGSALPNPRYPIPIEMRATQDLDVFLTSEVIVAVEKMQSLKDVMYRLDYEPSEKAKFFQFIKRISVAGNTQALKVDFLAAPPVLSDQHKVKINVPRIKPKGVDGIHAFLTDEALGIDFEACPISLSTDIDKQIVFIPSAFNYLILKMHAFHDRKDRTDENSDQGRHHAFDIFTTVCQMSEKDWDTAKRHFERDKNLPYLIKAIEIRQNDFASATAIGVLRLRENQGYQKWAGAYETYLQKFLEDLQELFGGFA